MTVLTTLLAVVLGILSIAAGAAKIALVPAEAEFHAQFGFTGAVVISFGLAQLLGGLLLIVPRTRYYGALVVAAGFALSVVLILVGGDPAFAIVSMLPVLLAGFIVYRCSRGTPD